MTSSQERQSRGTLRLAPFRGVRYDSRASDLDELTFIPPTSWSRVPADLLATLDPHHILRLLAPAFGPDAQAGARHAHATLTAWLAEGAMRRDTEPSLYVYEQPGAGEPVRGVIGTVDLTATPPALLDHEEVIESLVEIQETLEQTMHAQVEPILALHRGSPSLRYALAEVAATEPAATIIDDDGATHRLWRVGDPSQIERIAAAIPDEPALIADGHHRHAAWRRTSHDALALLSDFEQPGLRLGAIHRVIANVDPRTMLESDAIHVEALGGKAEAIRYLAHGPDARCVLYAGEEFHAATPARASDLCAAPELAVCQLHSHWLQQWGATEADVGYVHDIDEAISLTGNDCVAVLLPVPAIVDVIAAANEGRPLPRKATSFRPKPLVGTVLRTWDS